MREFIRSESNHDLNVTPLPDILTEVAIWLNRALREVLEKERDICHQRATCCLKLEGGEVLNIQPQCLSFSKYLLWAYYVPDTILAASKSKSTFT